MIIFLNVSKTRCVEATPRAQGKTSGTQDRLPRSKK